MASTSDIDLATLARVNAREFLETFLEKLGGEISIKDIYEIESLSDENIVDDIHIELVHSEGGYEGAGEHVQRVWSVNQGSNVISYIAVTGFYQSYNGTEYNDDWAIVQPREVVVTEYHPV